MIIDCHVHVKGGDTYRREFTADRILQTMDEAGIDQSVIFSICIPSRESNDLTMHCYRQAPDRFIPFAHVWVEDGAQAVAELDRAVNSLGCRGLKLHMGEIVGERSVEPFIPVCEAAREMDIPVLIDFGEELGIARELIEAVPDMKLIVAHLGSSRQETLIDKLIALALEYPQIVTDMSYCFCPWKIPEAIERLGADRILFGSDGPLVHPAIALAAVNVCKLSPEDYEKITWRNIERLLG